MPRLARNVLQRGYFHVLNRGNHRQEIFQQPDDYAEFVQLLAEAQERYPVGLWGYCLMANHWHLVAEVDRVEDLSQWMHWVSSRHVRLFNRQRPELGGGHVYQGRYKSFPIQDGVYLQQVLRFVEANPRRAHLVERAEDWPWSSLSPLEIKKGQVVVDRPALRPWPRNKAWEEEVNEGLEEDKQRSILQSIARGTPLGDLDWVMRTATERGMEATVRRRGRPRKVTSESPTEPVIPPLPKDEPRLDVSANEALGQADVPL